MGKILKKVSSSDTPIIIEKGRKDVAVLISIDTFNKRFVDLREEEKRKVILDRFKQELTQVKTDSTKLLREIRYAADS